MQQMDIFANDSRMDVEAFIQAMSEMINELKHVSMEIDNDATIHKILIKLMQRFEIFVKMLQNETRMPMLKSLGANLHLEESNQRLQSKTSTKEVLVMRICNLVRQNQGCGHFHHNKAWSGSYKQQYHGVGSSNIHQFGGYGMQQETPHKNFEFELL